MAADPQSPPGPGIVGSLRRLMGGILGILHTRLEILSTEIGEERLNLTQLALVALGVLFCFQSGILLGVLFIVLAVNDQNRLAAIGILALVLLVAALAGVLWLRAWLKSRPPMFGATVAELRKDLDRLRGQR